MQRLASMEKANLTDLTGNLEINSLLSFLQIDLNSTSYLDVLDLGPLN